MGKEKLNIAIYGLSLATQEVLTQLDNKYNVIGLLDGYRQSGTIYGKPIISMDQAIENNVKVIVVVARPSSRRIIVNRICEKCREHNIKLVDERGKDLLESHSHNMTYVIESGGSKEELLEKIERSQIISFDIFDTLITRTVLYQTDVFELVEQRIDSKYGQSFGFCEKRQRIERELSQTGTPTVYDIYKELEEQIELSKEELAEIREWEWQIEQQVIIPRYEMCRIFQYALEHKKKVYLVSDMYYPREQLKVLLTKLGIEGYEEIFVSCDYGTAKGQQLFQILKDVAQGESYLHIGDNYLTDVKAAERNGIEGFWIRSGLDLFETINWSERFAECSSLADRIKLGMFVSRVFNCPFALANTRLEIKEPEEMGYLLLAPIISQYCIWLYNTLMQKQESAILLGARDGYLLKRLLDELLDRVGEDNLNTIYFLISRISAVNAGIACEQDIICLAERAFNGSLKEVLQTRFDLGQEKVKSIERDEAITVEAILKYKDAIIERASVNRENYLKYIDTLGLDRKKVAFFDFVSTGTCQASLEKIMNQKMCGYYFIRVDGDTPEKRLLNVTSFYDDEEVRKEGGIYQDYFVLENILTSPMPTLKGFDGEGKPQYAREVRAEEDISFIMAVQDGIVEYFKQYMDVIQSVKLEGSKKCAENLLSLIHSIPIANDIFQQLIWDDNFYSRKIMMKDLL